VVLELACLAINLGAHSGNPYSAGNIVWGIFPYGEFWYTGTQGHDIKVDQVGPRPWGQRGTTTQAQFTILDAWLDANETSHGRSVAQILIYSTTLFMEEYPQGFYDSTPAILPPDSLHWYETPRCILIDMSVCVCTLVTLLDINLLQVTRNMVLFMLFNHTHTFVAEGISLTDIASTTVMGPGNAGNRDYTAQ
jgi:hypothetical protein